MATYLLSRMTEASAAEGAGRLLLDLPRLWASAGLEERRRLLLTMLDAVYVDVKEDRSIVAVKPKPAFRPVFQAVTREGSGVVLVNEPPDDDPEARLCFWWRRGSVQLYQEHRMMVSVQAA
jgi:hypothetical protein